MAKPISINLWPAVDARGVAYSVTLGDATVVVGYGTDYEDAIKTALKEIKKGVKKKYLPSAT